MKNLFLKNSAKSLAVISILFILAFAAIPVVHGQQGVPDQVEAPATVKGLFGIVDNVFQILFIALMLFAGIFIILAAFAYLTAGGDPEKIKKAGHRVMYAAVAVAVGVFAKAIPFIVADFIGGGAP